VQPIQYMRSSKLRILSLRGVAWIAVTLIASAAIAAGESKTAAPDKKTEEPPILIEADQLISNNEEKYAEFIGNVKASQADFTITSDKLRIYYEGDLLSKEEKTNQNDDTLKKIVASGNVKIRSDQYNADTEQRIPGFSVVKVQLPALKLYCIAKKGGSRYWEARRTGSRQRFFQAVMLPKLLK